MNVKGPIYRIVAAQFVMTFGAAILFLGVDWVSAYSVLLGGLTSAVPNFFMAWRMGREVTNPAVALKYLVRGELTKLALAAVMFAAVFLWVEPLNVAYFFITLVLVMLCNMLVPLIDARQVLRSRQEPTHL